ncbi:AAA family ATPase [Paenibacillus sp. 1A_MP2]|uniref:AAA family ATPase n=1 Tax=Paenibacillus sp. 1A_MP2 TaxID=3457495 RepID=UPI003FCE5EBC
MKTMVVVDVNSARINENVKVLSEYGKVFDARSVGEIATVLEREGHIDAIFFSVSVPNLKEAIRKVSREIKSEKGPATIYLVGATDPDTLTDLLSAGAKDVTPHPIQPNEVGLNRRLPSSFGDFGERIQTDFGSGKQTTKEKIILVCSPKGGEGKTTTSTQIAAVTAKITGGQCVLIDSDYAGNAHRKLGIEERSHTIFEFGDEDSQYWDRNMLESKLVTHGPTGLKVLCSPHGETTNVPSKMVSNAFLAYKRYYPNIVIDMHQGYTPTFHMLKDYATDIIYVCRPEADQHERTLDTLRQIYADAPDKLRIVINAIHDKDQVQPLRIAMEDFSINVPSYHMPYAREELQDLKTLPVFKDPKKSKYSEKFRHFLKDIGISNAMAPKKEVANEKVSSGSGIFGSFFNRRAK